MAGKIRDMLETSARLLRLLSLLQSRPDWPAGGLAERPGVPPRTAHRAGRRLPGVRGRTFRIPGQGRTPGGAVPAGPHRAALVSRGVRPGPGRLADLPGRPDRGPAVARAAVRAACAARRGRRRL